MFALYHDSEDFSTSQREDRFSQQQHHFPDLGFQSGTSLLGFHSASARFAAEPVSISHDESGASYQWRFHSADCWRLPQAENGALSPTRLDDTLKLGDAALSEIDERPIMENFEQFQHCSATDPASRMTIEGQYQSYPDDTTADTLTWSEYDCPSVDYPYQSQHQPIAPCHRSTYSELSANLAFLSQLSNTSEAVSKTDSQPDAAARPASSASARLSGGKREEKFRPSSPSSPASGGKSNGKKASEGRKQPNLACYFCRERKIACGRPAEGSADPTCNQCARRSYVCDYPTESHRGQHKRGRRKSYDHKVQDAP